MKLFASFLGLVLLSPFFLSAQPANDMERFSSHWNRIIQSVQSEEVTVRLLEAKGLPDELLGLEINLLLGDHGSLRLKGTWRENRFELARQGDELWIYLPEKEFGVRGKNSVPPFAADPDYLRQIRLDSLLRLPATPAQIQLLPLLFNVSSSGGEDGGEAFAVSSTEFTRSLLGITGVNTRWSFPASGTFPLETSLSYGGVELRLALDARPPEPESAPFDLGPEREAHVTDVALSHLVDFIRVASDRLRNRGREFVRREIVLATHGKGRLSKRDGVLVLYLEGSPEEMGEQHGVLLREQVRHVMDTVLYGVGVGSSFIRGSWFFGDIEEAQARLLPHMNPAYLREMDALAAAGGFHREEVRLANFFPELFHCSGFAMFDEATADGMLYHGRILDYISGLGLEEQAVLMVVNPDDGYSWLNVGYAGFTGTVTAMNEKGVAIGEMGGAGWGDWDGKPMAQLMREVMERAATVEEGIAIFANNPRTCEYYYVLSQANPNHAVGIYATPEKLELVLPGEAHPLLPRPLPSTVMLSSGNRYTNLVDRVESGFGRIGPSEAWELMARPVAMNSNIQTALFRPETLDLWIANADHRNVASAREPARFNLRGLLAEFQTEKN